jgi:Carboxypeptidase regulatory-like domain
MRIGRSTIVAGALCSLLLGGCAAGISGTVRLLDANNKPLPDVKPQGIIVNLINTTSPVERASHSVKTDEKGEFSVGPEFVTPGIYRVEASEAGFLTATKTIEVRKSSRSVELDLRRIPRGMSQSYRGMKSDKDKIINPGEVNIQPPSL